MNSLILYGNGSFAKLLKYYIDHDDRRTILAVTVEEQYINSSTFENLPLIPFETIEDAFPPDKVDILLGVGYSKMNDVRKRIFLTCKQKGYHIAQYIHSSSILSNVKMGEGNIILEDTLIEPFVTIGDGNLLWHKLSIAHDTKIGNYNTITGMSSVCGFVEIGNNCFLGSGCVIRDKIKLDDYTLVDANTYVSTSTEKYDAIVSNKSIRLSNKKSTDLI